MDKKKFLKMVEKGDVDDTEQFWSDVYDAIYLKGWQDKAIQMVTEIKQMMKS